MQTKALCHVISAKALQLIGIVRFKDIRKVATQTHLVFLRENVLVLHRLAVPLGFVSLQNGVKNFVASFERSTAQVERTF